MGIVSGVAYAKIVLTLADGEVLERSLFMGDPSPPWMVTDMHPDWMVVIDRAWPHPQEPVTLRANVAPGSEVEARAWLFWDEALDG